MNKVERNDVYSASIEKHLFITQSDEHLFLGATPHVIRVSYNPNPFLTYLTLYNLKLMGGAWELDDYLTVTDITLNNVELEGVNRNASFERLTLTIKDSLITGDCSFAQIESLTATFKNTEINGDVSFKGCKGGITLDTCESKNNSSLFIDSVSTIFLNRLKGFKEIKLADISLYEGSKIDIAYCDLNCFDIQVADPKYISFKNVTWAQEKRCWRSLLVGSLRTFRKNGFDFPKGIAEEEEKKYSESQEEKYIELKKVFAEAEDSHLKGEFHYAQLYWENKARWNLMNQLYYMTCGYGLSPFLPLVFLFLVFLLFALFYNAFLGDLAGYDAFWDSLSLSLSSVNPLGEGLSGFLSAFNDEAGVLELSSPNAFWVQLLYYLQRAIELFLVFEFGSAVRNRVKQ